jgi:hypothetical protein
LSDIRSDVVGHFDRLGRGYLPIGPKITVAAPYRLPLSCESSGPGSPDQAGTSKFNWLETERRWIPSEDQRVLTRLARLGRPAGR